MKSNNFFVTILLLNCIFIFFKIRIKIHVKLIFKKTFYIGHLQQKDFLSRSKDLWKILKHFKPHFLKNIITFSDTKIFSIGNEKTPIIDFLILKKKECKKVNVEYDIIVDV